MTWRLSSENVGAILRRSRGHRGDVMADRLRGLDHSPEPLPEQRPPPPPAGAHRVQLLRTYPNLGPGRDYPFAPGGSAASLAATPRLWGGRRGWSTSRISTSGEAMSARVFAERLQARPELRAIIVIPLVPDLDGLNRVPQLLGRHRAIDWLQAPRSRTRRGVRPGEPCRGPCLRACQGLHHRRRLGQLPARTTSVAARGPTIPNSPPSSLTSPTPATCGSPSPPSTSTGSTKRPNVALRRR